MPDASLIGYASYSLLAVAVLFSRLPLIPINLYDFRIHAWQLGLLVSLVLALISKCVTAFGAVSVVCFFGLVAYYANTKNNKIRAVLLLVTLLYSLAMGLHLIPGFNSTPLLTTIFLGNSSIPVSLNLSYDKSAVGLILLGCLGQQSNANPPRSAYREACIGILLLASIGVGLGLKYDPKFNSAILLFLACNLFFTCIAEETFFRLLVQNTLIRVSHRMKFNNLFTITVTSLFFIAVHAGPKAPISGLILIGFGGLFYSYLYQRYRSINLAILVHFLANAVHILLLTYPYPLN